MINSLAELRKRMTEIPDGRCVIGFSGGADSTAMIRLLAMERDEKHLEPEAIHVNHGLRGTDSDEDEVFCRNVCRELKIPLKTFRIDLGGRKDENACRQARFQCFREWMAARSIQTLVLAHNRDDLAETFLMRLMRGAGLQGLDCMSSRDEMEGIVLIRPMLRIGRNEIREALKKEGLAWREDETNRQDIYLRNDVRKRLIPLLEEMAKGSTERIARTAEILTEENRLLCGMTEQFLKEHSRPKQIDAEALKEIPESFRIRILRSWWQQNAPKREEHALDYRQSRALAALVTAERGKINLPDQLNAVRGRHTIHLTGFSRKKEEVPYSSNGIQFGSCRLMTFPSMNHPGDGILVQEVPEEFAEGCVIRTRRPGDRIHPFGMNGSKKLQDYFTDRKIDEPWRDEIPLLCRGNEVFLAAGVGAGAVPLWNKDCNNVRLEWRGDFPWLNTERKEITHGQEC